MRLFKSCLFFLSLLVFISACGGSDSSSSDFNTASWTHPANLIDHISLDGQHVAYPHLAISNSGYAIVAWQQSDGSISQIFISERDGTSGLWKHPANLADNISPDGQNADAKRPQVAINDSGDAIVTWYQADTIAGHHKVFISERDGITGVWTHPTNLNDNISPNHSASLPQVTINNAGDAIDAWIQFDGSENQVFISERNGMTGAWINRLRAFVMPGSVRTLPSGAARRGPMRTARKYIQFRRGEARCAWTRPA